MRRSRLLRLHSNFWVWVETGRWLRDTQSGFRAYPLKAVCDLALRTDRYAWEIEVLVKAVWRGTPVVEVPVAVRYETASRSHFRPLRDFLLVSRLNCWLVAMRLLLRAPVRQRLVGPEGQRGSGCQRVGQITRAAIDEAAKTPGRFGLSVGLGASLGILPIWGFQGASAVAASRLLRLNQVVTLAASNISFPAALPFVLYASVVVGRLLLDGSTGQVLRLEQPTIAGALALGSQYVIGAVVLAIAAGLVLGLGSYGLARFARAIRRRVPQ
jgi:uncharacterized protein (DUF2062 family)